MYTVLENYSELDIIYCENICTKNFNVSNLTGSRSNRRSLYIDRELISFENQNLLACKFFEEILSATSCIAEKQFVVLINFSLINVPN